MLYSTDRNRDSTVTYKYYITFLFKKQIKGGKAYGKG